MSEFATIMDQARQFVSQHVDPVSLAKTMPLAGGALLVGVGLSVFGAKLARLGVTFAFAALGLAAGFRFGAIGGFQPIPCALIGAAMLGVIAHLTFRLWIGLAAGLVLSSITLGVFGYERVLPHAVAFQPLEASSALAPGQFSIPTPDAQRLYVDRTPREFLNGLRQFIGQRDALAERDAGLWGAATFVVGTLLGVLALRWMLILTTSLAGTILVTSSLATLLVNFVPRSYDTIIGHPTMAGVGTCAFLLGSLVLQVLLTRKAPSPQGE